MNTIVIHYCYSKLKGACRPLNRGRITQRFSLNRSFKSADILKKELPQKPSSTAKNSSSDIVIECSLLKLKKLRTIKVRDFLQTRIDIITPLRRSCTELS